MGLKTFLWETMGWGAFKAQPKTPRRLFDPWASSASVSANEYAFDDTATGWIRAVKSNVWARNCVSARMSAMAQVPWKLYRGRGDDRVEVDTHPVLDLLREVNPLTHDAISFRKATEQQLSIFGQAVILKVRGASREVRELYLLPSVRVEVIPDEDTFVAGYALKSTSQRWEVEDVIRLWYPAPDGSVNADSPTSAALGPINRYALAEIAQRAQDARGGNAGGIVFHDPNATTGDDFDRVVRDWDRVRNNPLNAGRDMHIMGALEYKSNAFSAVNMDREARNLRLMNEIMAAYQVPPAIAGDYSDASKLANAAVQSRAFWELWALDELRMWEEAFNYDLLWAEWPGSREDGLMLEHDLSGIAALQEDATEKAARAVSLFAGGLATRNEARSMAALDKLDDAAGDVLVAQMGEAPTEETGANKPEPDPEPLTAAPAEPDQPVEPAEPTVEQEGAKAVLMPVLDFVGMAATDLDGRDLGPIERIHRFGEFGDVVATKADPVVVVGGALRQASTIRVRIG